MSHTTAIGALLLGLSLVLLAPRAQAQDRVRLGGCPTSYITTFDFDARKISELIGSTGYQAVMTLGTRVEESHTCQKLQLFEGAAFSYSYMDADGKRRLVAGRYRAAPTSFNTQGFLELSGLPAGVLGATIFGIAHLFPLVSRADAQVYLSCSQLGIVHTENVYTFVPNTPAGLRDAEDVRDTLALMGVPYSKTLVRSDQTCQSPEEPANDSSNDNAVLDTSTRNIATSNASSSNSSSTDTTLSGTLASDASTSGASASDASSSGASASDASSSGASASDASSSGASASDASSRGASASDGSSSGASASDASSSGVSASAASPSGGLSSNASLSGVSASNASSSGASASDASSGPAASSDASSSDVLPSGASSNDALASVASSIDALASDALSLDASSNPVSVASSPAEDSPQRDVDSNAVEDGLKGASLDVVEQEPVTESSVDEGQASQTTS